MPTDNEHVGNEVKRYAHVETMLDTLITAITAERQAGVTVLLHNNNKAFILALAATVNTHALLGNETRVQ
jgi:hypothetical protein